MATAASPSAQKPPSPPQTDQKPATENAEQRDKQQDPDEVQRDQREAYEYWGYLFNPDKTGTDKLKSLLRGLKDIMVSTIPKSHFTRVISPIFFPFRMRLCIWIY